MKEQKIKKVLSEFRRNPFWNEYYETAPSDTCKRYIELEFCCSGCFTSLTEYEKIKKNKKHLEEEFTTEDWRHLYRFCGHNPLKVYYKRKMEETASFKL